MRIGVLTGGGDSPGINAALRAIVRKAAAEGVEVIGFRDGWRGLVDDLTAPLGLKEVSGILPTGGTILGTSRTNPFKKENRDGKTVWERTDKVDKVLATYERHGLDCLIAIGGDDTLGVAAHLVPQGIKAIGIPQTIDNDLWGTDYSIGFPTALSIVMEALDRLHTTSHAHHRAMIVEVMGRDAGWIAVQGGMAGGADVILIPERPFSVEDVVARIRKRLDMDKRFSIIVVAEGAIPAELGYPVIRAEEREDNILRLELGHPPEMAKEKDAFGHPQYGGSIGYWLANRLQDYKKELEGLTPRVTVLAYLQRGGVATAFDRLLATRLGVRAVELALEGASGVMVGMQGEKVVPVPLEEVAANSPRLVPDELIELAEIFY
ncbi:MAG TPA: 6-phosphofructokinase [Candidatus Acetothermia bacterium]|nr:6-phosphofructokinase [Candidatus Acetothermia bacterium]